MLPRIALRSRPIPIIVALAASLAVVGCSAAVTTPNPSRAPEASPSIAAGAGASQTAKPSAAAASARATASPSATPKPVAWRLVRLPDASGAAQIADVIARPGFVAAAASGTTGTRGIAWSSLDDGATWTAEPMPGPAGFLTRLVPWGDRTLAIGEGDGDCAHPSTVGIWVRSVAGLWTAAPADPMFCAGGTASAAASGLVATIVGAGAGDVPYQWSSTDGLHWDDESRVLGGRLPAGIAVDKSGFLAVGSGFAPAAAAWASHSKDGTTWDGPHPIAGTVGLFIVGDPIESKGDLAIFATDSAGAVNILRLDGEGGWRSESCDGLNGDTVSRFIAVGGSLVALGGDRDGPRMWASADGASWRPLALPAEARTSGSAAALTGVAVAGGHAYLVGQVKAPTGTGTIGALWTGPASLLAP
jgi:hypothetical protein